MQEMIALVASVVIGAVILLILALIQWRGQHASIDAAQFASAKSGMLDLVNVFEDDLTNLGAGLSVADMEDGLSGTTPNVGGFTGSFGSVAFDTSSTSSPRTIQFYAWADTSTTANALATSTNVITYSWDNTGETVLVLDPASGTYVSRPTLILRRTVDGNPAGESLDTITEITIDLFNAAGMTTGSLADVRTLEVTVKAVSPLGGGESGMIDTEAGLAPTVSETRWHKTIRPPNLGRKSS